MLLDVSLIEELVDFHTGIRRTLAVCTNRDIAEAWIEKNGGNQMVMLNNGEVVPLYRIDDFVVMHRPTDFDPIE
jgi:hypothetical protein